jgi:uncharacterized peroxidase-related enzyme
MTQREDDQAWIPMIPEAEARGELAELYRQVAEPDGSVDNILKIHSLDPASLRAHFQLYRQAMRGPGELTRAQREMIAVVVSSLNRCHY